MRIIFLPVKNYIYRDKNQGDSVRQIYHMIKDKTPTDHNETML